MNRVRHYLHLLLTTPPAGIWRRVKQRGGQYVRRAWVRLPRAWFSRGALRRALIAAIPGEDALVRHLLEGKRPAFFIDERRKTEMVEQFR